MAPESADSPFGPLEASLTHALLLVDEAGALRAANAGARAILGEPLPLDWLAGFRPPAPPLILLSDGSPAEASVEPHPQGWLLSLRAAPWTTLLESLPGLAVILSPEGLVLCANERWRRSAAARGGPPGAWLGEDYFQAVEAPTPEEELIIAGLRAVIAGRERALTADYDCGAESWQVTASPLTQGATLIVHQDLTEPRQMSRRLSQLNAELRRSNEILATLARTLGQTVERPPQAEDLLALLAQIKALTGASAAVIAELGEDGQPDELHVDGELEAMLRWALKSAIRRGATISDADAGRVAWPLRGEEGLVGAIALAGADSSDANSSQALSALLDACRVVIQGRRARRERRRIEELNARLARIVEDSTSEVLILTEPGLRVVQANARARENLALEGLGPWARTLPGIQTALPMRVHLAHLEALRSGAQEKVRYETLHRRPNGSAYSVAVSLERVRGEGDIYVATVEDISREVEASAALSRFEARIDALREVSPVGMFVCSAEGRVLEVNRRVREITGRDGLEGPNALVQLGVDEEDRPIVAGGWAAARGSRRLRMEFRVRRPGGERRWVSVEAAPEGDSPRAAWVGTVIDVTERREREQELAELNEFLSSVFENLPAVILAKDVETRRYMRFNRFGLQLRGLGADVIGLRAEDTLSPEQAAVINASDAKVLATGEMDIHELVVHSLETGEEHLLRVRKVLVKGAEGEPRYLLGIAEDITEQRARERELAEVNAFLTSIIDTIPSHLAIKDARDGRLVRANETSLTALGLDGEEVRGKTVHEYFPEPVARAFQASDERALASQALIEDEVEVLDRHGARRIWQVRKRALRDAEGAPTYILSVAEDITEQRAYERELAELNTFLDSIIDNIPSLVFVKSADDLRFLRFNEYGLELMGLRPEMVIGKRDEEFMPVEEARVLQRTDRRVLATGELDSRVEIITVPAGRRVLRTKKIAITGADGAPRYLLGISEDITDRRRQEQALEESEARLSSVMENAPALVAQLDREGRVTFVNRPEAAGRAWLDAALESREVAEAILAALAEQEARSLEARLTREGERRWFELRVAPTRVAGETTGVVVIASDIQARREAEALLRGEREDLERAVAERTGELREANRQLARANFLKDQFLASMSHELRTPLTSMLGLSEALLEGLPGPLTAEQTRALTTVHDSGKHLLALIQDILDIAKIEAGQLDLRLGPVHLGELARACQRLFEREAEAAGLELALAISEPEPEIVGDERRIRQIVMNLLSNALKFTEEGGRVTLRVRAEEETAEIEVEDSGLGIAARDQARIFEPFIQLSAGLDRSHGGTGLGLSLVASLTSMHGGSVRLRSELGVGSCFSVTLPARPPQPEGERKRSPRPLLRSHRVTETGRLVAPPRIGLVEGHRETALMVSSFLSAKSYIVQVFESAEELLEQMGKSPFDLLIVAFEQVGISGLELLARLRSHERWRGVPTLLLCAAAASHVEAACLAAGAAGVLEKPVKLAELLRRVEEVRGHG